MNGLPARLTIGVESPLGALGAAAVIGHDQLDLAAENAACRVDLLDGELAGLDDGGRDDAVSAAEADGNADLDRLLRRGAAGHGSQKRDASG